MTKPIENRVGGALCGLAIGDAMARSLGGLSPEAVGSRDATETYASDTLVHGALTTWVLAVLDALLYRRPTESLGQDLAWRLQILARPLRGLALRGAPHGLTGTLRDVANRLDVDEDRRLVGETRVRSEGVVAVLPLAFALGDDDSDVADAMVEVVSLTHRHIRVTSAAGLWLGGLRHLLRRGISDRDALLDASCRFAELALARYEKRNAGIRIGSSTEAQGALWIHRAQVQAVDEIEALFSPAGLDARDTPERLVLAALCGAGTREIELTEVLRTRCEHGGDVDIMAPLLGATRGIALGQDRLPLGQLNRLATRLMIVSRASALFEPRPPRLPPLIDEEIRISTRLQQRESPLDCSPPPEPPRRQGQQLKLV